MFEILHSHYKNSVFSFNPTEGCPTAEESIQARKACLQPTHPSPSLLKNLPSTNLRESAANTESEVKRAKEQFKML